MKLIPDFMMVAALKQLIKMHGELEVERRIVADLQKIIERKGLKKLVKLLEEDNKSMVIYKLCFSEEVYATFLTDCRRVVENAIYLKWHESK